MVTISAPAVDPSRIAGPIEVTLNNQKFAMIDWKSYEEMAKAKRNAEYLAMLDRGFAQMKAGKCQQHDLIYED